MSTITTLFSKQGSSFQPDHANPQVLWYVKRVGFAEFNGFVEFFTHIVTYADIMSNSYKDTGFLEDTSLQDIGRLLMGVLSAVPKGYEQFFTWCSKFIIDGQGQPVTVERFTNPDEFPASGIFRLVEALATHPDFVDFFDQARKMWPSIQTWIGKISSPTAP